LFWEWTEEEEEEETFEIFEIFVSMKEKLQRKIMSW
jgi:hypothetical protein